MKVKKPEKAWQQKMWQAARSVRCAGETVVAEGKHSSAKVRIRLHHAVWGISVLPTSYWLWALPDLCAPPGQSQSSTLRQSWRAPLTGRVCCNDRRPRGEKKKLDFFYIAVEMSSLRLWRGIERAHTSPMQPVTWWEREADTVPTPKLEREI